MWLQRQPPSVQLVGNASRCRGPRSAPPRADGGRQLGATAAQHARLLQLPAGRVQGMGRPGASERRCKKEASRTALRQASSAVCAPQAINQPIRRRPPECHRMRLRRAARGAGQAQEQLLGGHLLRGWLQGTNERREFVVRPGIGLAASAQTATAGGRPPAKHSRSPRGAGRRGRRGRGRPGAPAPGPPAPPAPLKWPPCRAAPEKKVQS